MDLEWIWKMYFLETRAHFNVIVTLERISDECPHLPVSERKMRDMY